MTDIPPFSGWILSVTDPDREGRKPRTAFYDVAVADEQDAIEALRRAVAVPDDAVIATVGHLTERVRKAGYLKLGEVKAH